MVEDIEVVLSPEQPTVATLRWRTTEPAFSQVTFGESGGPTATTPLEPDASTEHEAVLVGVPQEREILFSISALSDAGVSFTAEGVYTTGRLVPLDVDLSVEQDAERSAGGIMLLPVLTSPPGTEVHGQLNLVDAVGERLWAVDGGLVYRARLAPDGRGLVYLSGEKGGSWLREISWTGEVLWAVDVPRGQRDFAIVGEDTYAVLVKDSRSIEGYPGAVDGDALVLVHPDGTQEDAWSVFDALGPGWCAEEHAFNQDWSHANYLSWLPDQGLLLIVLRSFPAIVAVDPFSRAQAWILSATCSDFVWSEPVPLFVNPHSVEPTADGLLVFDQGSEPDGCSGAMEIAFDPDTPEVTPLWSWKGSRCQHTYFMGNAQLLDDGHRLVVLNGAVSEVTLEGEVVYRLGSSLGAGFCYVERVAGLYP
jgi:hypothetical protein